MIVGKPFPFIINYPNQLSDAMENTQIGKGMTYARKKWLMFCLTAIMVTNSICWRKFSRVSLGSFTEALLSWHFRSPMTWDLLLLVSVKLILTHFAVTEGLLLIDDTGKKRSKVTKRLPYIHHFKSKEGTGTVRGQEVVFLVLVTALFTIPVGYEFYQPDPAYTKWAKQEKRLRKQKVLAKNRPKKPARNPAYPTKQEIALTLLKQFASFCPFVKVKAVLADCLYGNADFMKQVSEVFDKSQTISQLHSNQKIYFRNKIWHLDEYFKAYPGVSKTVSVRGFDTKEVIVSSARLYVEAHKCKRFVVAMRYANEPEKNNRYIVATNLTWRTIDIVQAYIYRWLVEVAIEDLKVYGGWGQSTKHPDEEGSRRGLILSLLCDHSLLLHPDQQACIAHKQPLYTIGSLQRRLQMESFTTWLEDWTDNSEFKDKLDQLTEAIRPLFPLKPSKKHSSGQKMGRLEPTPGLKYRGLEDATAIS